MPPSYEHDYENLRLTANLGDYQAGVDSALQDIKNKRIISRLWAHDHTLWKPEPDEIENRLGWLDIVPRMRDDLSIIEDLTQEVISEGYTHALLLGMGGSSLAPEVFRKIFGVRAGYLDLKVLDSTDPDMVRAQAERLDPGKTLFIVSTKSGGTVETLSLYKYFFGLTSKSLGSSRAGDHFVAITDPGSRLAEEADRRGFRARFLNDSRIGGRFSALSYFGLVPAALIGVDTARLLERAEEVRNRCTPSAGHPRENPGASLGAILGKLAASGRDKLTFLTSSKIACFGDWLEQLIAESTGKEGKGLLPVVDEPRGEFSVYGNDRLFIRLEMGEESVPVPNAGGSAHPEVRIRFRDRYDIGGQIFLWEIAVAVAGERLGINPFDQPDVETAKQQARMMVALYEKSGRLPIDAPSKTRAETLDDFLGKVKPGDYIALLAYLKPSPETDTALQALRVKLRDRSRLAVTFGYGPRYLHSTGQLHKGDRGRGHFIVMTADNGEDVPIPKETGSDDSRLSFGILKMAQALGDEKALRGKGRHIIRLHLSSSPADDITTLTRMLT